MRILAYDESPSKYPWWPRHPYVSLHDIGVSLFAIVMASQTSGWTQSYFVIVVLMFSVSAFHHWLWFAYWRHLLDRIVIYFLIAGTCLPYIPIALEQEKQVLLAVLAVATFLGPVCNFFGIGMQKGLPGSTLYSAVGLLSVSVMIAVHQALPVHWAVVFWSGTFLYAFQMISYDRGWFDFKHNVFGVREMQHTFLLVAILCHTYTALLYGQ